MLAHLLVLQNGLGEVERGGHTVAADLKFLTRHGVLLIVFQHPVGQLFHIIGTGDEASRRFVVPVGSVGSMSCGQNGGTVFQRHAHHLSFLVGSHLQLVADGCREEMNGGSLTGFTLCSNRLHAVVLAA